MRPVHSAAIFASAGTGKTYRLTNHYLALLTRDVPPDRILAITFTRQAAREIFERVAGRLLGAVSAERSRAELERALGLEQLPASRCVGLLAELFRRPDRIRVSTLDGLFSRLAGSFEDRLDLPPGWRIVSEDEDLRLREDALELAVERAEPAEMLELLRMLAQDSFRASVYRPALDALEECHHTRTLTADSAWRTIVPPASPLTTAAAILDARRAWAECDLRDSKDKVPASWLKSRDKSLGLIDARDWESFVSSGLPEKILRGETTFSRIEIPARISRALAPLVEHARSVLVSRHVDATLAAKHLAERFDEAYRGMKRVSRGLRFDDIPRELAAADATGDLEELYYRLDGAVDHLLLDEFQDTSVLQFRLVAPIVAELLSGGEGRLDESRSVRAFEAGRTVLCVGDVKQSLYGWRDAEPALLSAAAERWPQLERETLSRSFRSSQTVLDATNRVLGTLESNPAFERDPSLRAAAGDWGRDFREHEAALVLPGSVALRVSGATAGESGENAAVLLAACTRVQALHAECPGASIGVLLRAKKHVPALMRYLALRGVAASEESGSPLTDTPPINTALSALHLCDHPADTAARFHVAGSPLGAVLGLTDWRDDAAVDRIGSRCREAAAHGGVASLLMRWLEAQSNLMTGAEARRFEQLLEMTRGWDRANPGTFVFDRFIRRARSERVDAPGGAPVRIMTIHASKGLEFDAVVLPDLDGKLLGTPPRFILNRPDPLESMATVTRYPNETLQACHEELRALATAQRARMFRESLSVLYVAMTRARRALEMVIAPGKDGTLGLTFSGVLRGALAPDLAPAPGAVLFERHDGAWFSGIGAGEEIGARGSGSASVAGSGGVPIEVRPADPGSIRTLTRRRPSARAPMLGRLPERAPEQVQSGEPRTLIESRAGLVRGTVFHAWFELIGWLDLDGIPDRDSLWAAAVRQAPESLGEFEAHRTVFLRTVESGAFREWLGRGSLLSRWPGGTDACTYRELSVAVPGVGESGKPELVSGQIDRLSVVLSAGRPVGAEILDFKTDSFRPGAEGELAERYRDQLETYRRCVSRLWKLDASSIVCRLMMVGTGVAIEVGD